MNNFLRKTWSLFSLKERSQLGLLLILILTGTFVEILGIGATIPIVATLSKPEIIQEQAALRFFYHLLGASSTKEFMIGMGWVLIGIYVFKNALLLTIQ